MTISALPLSYCTNVHPGLTLSEVYQGLTDFTLPLRDRVGELAAGLWLARPVVTELLADGDRELESFRDWLRDSGLTCFTLNTFPYGNFHDARVKENVYRPDWADPRRLDYTLDCARVLIRLLPDEDVTGSLSTVPLGFKQFEHPEGFVDRCVEQLLTAARQLEQLREETGRTVRLAIEPEPCCLLETTAETIEFFDQLRTRAKTLRVLDAVTDFVGVCFDVCHQAVEFEDIAASIRDLNQHMIRIEKLHISSAIRLEHPQSDTAAREALARYVEPRYLHQTIGRRPDGTLLRAVDLTKELAASPPSEFASADEWRVHFHVPVHADSLGPLGTTRDSIREALRAVRELPNAPHLEIETYTWEVLPDAAGESPSLVDGLTREVQTTRALMESLASANS